MKRLRELVAIFIGGIVMLVMLLGLMFLIVSMDDSPNKCATKIATKVYDPKCF